MYLVINKCVTAVKVSNFSGHYLRNRSTLDISVLGYIGIVQHKEHYPEVLSIPPGTPCTYFCVEVQVHCQGQDLHAQTLWLISTVCLYRTLRVKYLSLFCPHVR